MKSSIANSSQQRLDLRTLIGREWNLRSPCATTVIAVEIAGGLHSINPQRACNALAGRGNALLLLARELRVMILPGKIDFLAGLRRTCRKRQDRPTGAGIERPQQRSGRSGQ